MNKTHSTISRFMKPNLEASESRKKNACNCIQKAGSFVLFTNIKIGDLSHSQVQFHGTDEEMYEFISTMYEFSKDMFEYLKKTDGDIKTNAEV